MGVAIGMGDSGAQAPPTIALWKLSRDSPYFY
jgi:hypothetical protein